jgi:D-psicose/D-tagatose/L-ribulose 3-epimerase
MRFSINTVLFVSPFGNKDTRLYARFKRWGFEAVELLVEDHGHIDPGHVKSELDKLGSFPVSRYLPVPISEASA